MPFIQHAKIPWHDVPRIRTRVLAGPGSGAAETAVWEQWISPDGFIPLHYHEVEEVLVLLAGSAQVTLGNTEHQVSAEATIVVPAGELHAVRPCEGHTIHLLALFPVAQPQIFAPDGRLRPLPWDDLDTRSPD